jgi:hypothetical protein
MNMNQVGTLSFEIVESKEGLQLQVRVVGNSRGCGFDTEAKVGELKQLARYLETTVDQIHHRLLR